MKIDPDDFRVKDGKSVNLKKWPTEIKSYYEAKKQFKEGLEERVDELSELQNLLYASNRFAVLLIFQAMDAAGKDSAIKHVMSGVNPQGCQVFSFKHPSLEELDHDFLWRTTRNLPERGRIGIFNRSYYEEVLIVRVHKELLRAENLPEEILDDKNIWNERYRSIRDLEAHLYRNGTRIVKFFLHISKEEQRKRFLARLDEPEKNWKFSLGDVAERKLWDRYQAAYQDMIRHTASAAAPWYVVPADRKWFARVVIGSVIVNALEKLDLQFPKVDKAALAQFDQARIALEKEGKGGSGGTGKAARAKKSAR
ncbi:MAG: ADP-polyphosphate phosphotransferase [Candidatus Binatia bacterium]